MGYEGDRMAPFVAHTARRARHAARELCNAGGERMTVRVRENTPKDTWHLHDNTFKKNTMGPFMEGDGGETYYSGTETDVSYGPHVEWGTGLWGPKHDYYEITPKDPDGFLKFHGYLRNSSGQVRLNPRTGHPMVSSEPTFAKVVMHPGSPGNHMFALGAAMAEHEFPEYGQSVLQRWSIESERIPS